ncbi:MAG: methylated-DNA--[protein]-cysteine S-methyltransferase [bacterium]|nr:methylated-DNA--[protein]-cysteine S-methyltransferase [bacterium]
MSSKTSEVYKVVSDIPKGKVMTYGQIGEILSMNPRLVGRILHENPDPETVPCHRVVNSRGEVAEKYAFGGGDAQRQKLKQEGVEFVGNRVNIEKSFYKRNH